MEAIVERCCGLDVHQGNVVACLLIGAADQKPRKEVRRYSTTRPELEAMRAWLAAAGCTHVAMESTGVYWQPVYGVLEGHFDLVVGNAHHIIETAWVILNHVVAIARLLAIGLSTALKPSL
jgi:hypothetical protein